MVDSERVSKAAQQGQQGRWLNWDGVEEKNLKWRDIWERSFGCLLHTKVHMYADDTAILYVFTINC